MTDQESKRIYQYAKLGKAVIDVLHKSYFKTDSICAVVTPENYCCQDCKWYEFCKIRQEVDK